MNQRLSSILACCLLLLTVAACQPVIAPPTTCVGDFEATVYSGPSAGLSLQGALSINLDAAGNLTGQLTTAAGQEVRVVGQAMGRMISLVFFVGENQYIFGAGASENPLYQCTGVFGGGFTGPQPGDSGDWECRDANLFSRSKP
jgi:hypothetical protein